MMRTPLPSPVRAPALVVGLGQLGTTFACGLLRRGVTVVPILRRSAVEEVLARYPDPSLVLLAVGELDLGPLLDGWCRRFADRLVLLQNELRPTEWERRGLSRPTVAVVWFEKKPGRSPRALLPTLVHGAHAELLVAALSDLGLPSEIESDPEQLVFALVLKNLFVLGTNICGLMVGGDTGTLLREHQPLLDRVTSDLLGYETAQFGRSLPETALRIKLESALLADPSHACAGRSARSRMQRVLAEARRLGVPMPNVELVANSLGEA